MLPLFIEYVEEVHYHIGIGFDLLRGTASGASVQEIIKEILKQNDQNS